MSSRAEFRKHGFYETPAWVARIIADHIPIGQRTQVIDLGAGKGSLINAIKSVKPNTWCDAIEIDGRHYSELSIVADKIHNVDVLKKGVPEKLFQYNKRLVIISNPPFGKYQLSNIEHDMLINNGFLSEFTCAKNARQEVIFLANSLRVAKKGTYVSFIVPTTILCNDLWKKLRETLVEKHRLSGVFILPNDVFQATEVKSAIIFMEAYGGMADTIKFVDLSAENVDMDYISPDMFINSKFNREITEGDNVFYLGKLLKEMYRGISCSKQLKDKNINHIHSSDVRCLHSKKISLAGKVPDRIKINERHVKAGDILVARVGTRCLGAATMIGSGEAVISDSVISLRVPAKNRDYVFSKLTSERGQEWFRKSANGSCAKIITYSDIHGFPLGVS